MDRRSTVSICKATYQGKFARVNWQERTWGPKLASVGLSPVGGVSKSYSICLRPVSVDRETFFFLQVYPQLF